ncbi:MAG: integration host factor subunit alpha [Deltaproteobacteria bacterium]|nr:integration host factor subunit alpha [Deltaproteobacteria bacterium]
MTLTKVHLINSVHNHLGMPKHKSIQLVGSILEIIKTTLENGEDVLISGFGKLCVKEKKERRSRNPATGDDMILDRRWVVPFKCSPVLKEKVNGKRSTPGMKD